MNPRRVVVFTKHRFLGDTIAALPLLAAVRDTYPEATVSLVTGRGAATLLEHSPAVHRVHAIDPKASQRGLGGSLRLSVALVRLARALRREGPPDLCLIPDRSLRAAAAARLTGAPIRVGFDTEGRGALLTHRVPYRDDRREVECCLDLLRAVASEPADAPWSVLPRLVATDAERAAGRALLPDPDAVWIGLQPGASHAYKAWPQERWVALGRRLRDGGARVLVTGGPDEVVVGERVTSALGGDALDLTGKTRMRETMGLVANLACFVSADTGLGHIAAALGTPTVTLFGPTPAHKWRNVGPANRDLDAGDGAMETIPVDAVLATVRSLVGGVR